MSLVAATKVASITLALGASAAGGGLGLGYVFQNNDLGIFKKEKSVGKGEASTKDSKIKENSDASSLALEKTKKPEVDLSLATEVIYKGETFMGGPACQIWPKEVVGNSEPINSEECDAKVEKLWPKGGLEQQPEIWLRASETNAFKFFKRILGISERNKDFLKRRGDNKWTYSNRNCVNKQDTEFPEKIVVNCNPTTPLNPLTR
ncbi:hypothetical protein [Mycoplasma suis]|uniref:Uncharacterized protein n=1 Tax=Mycoplasma suis (strain Illinois) TaxID=768700 RepID=F0QQD9_MYCSL|nr:hypothetical protein [Mycoplasma suis]ADX97709.1 hypothetical protein MSU_0165 [Mycoplasma suis str. Illinois]